MQSVYEKNEHIYINNFISYIVRTKHELSKYVSSFKENRYIFRGTKLFCPQPLLMKICLLL